MKKSINSKKSWILFVLIIFLFTGCNTSRGGAVRRTSERDTQEAARAEERENRPQRETPQRPQNPTTPDPPSSGGGSQDRTNPFSSWSDEEDEEEEDEDEFIGIRITSSPTRAKIYVDDTYYGTTPQTISFLFPQSLNLRLEKDGYRPLERVLYYGAGGLDEYDFQLERITGELSLDGEFFGARLIYNGRQLNGLTHTLGVGSGTLVASRFGFEDQVFPIVIRDGLTTRLEAKEWQPAPLEITNFRIFRMGFQRDYQRITFRFDTNGPGQAALKILSPQGELVEEFNTGEFDDWNEQIIWRMSPKQKETLNPGVYQAALIVEDGPELAVDFTLDYALIRRPDQFFYSSSQGQLYSPDAWILPPGDLGISTGFTAVSEGELTHLLVNSSFILGIGEGLQFATSASQRFYSDGQGNSWYLNFGVKSRIGELASLESSWYSTLALSSFFSSDEFSPPSTDPFTNPAGLKAGVALTLDLGDFNFNLAPELVFTWQTITYQLQGVSEPGVMGYLRSGITWTNDFADFSLSGALRARNPQNGFGILHPLQLGGTVRFRNEGDWSLNFLSTLDYWSPEVWALTLGVGTSVYAPSMDQLSNNLFPALDRPE